MQQTPPPPAPVAACPIEQAIRDLLKPFVGVVSDKRIAEAIKAKALQDKHLPR